MSQASEQTGVPANISVAQVTLTPAQIKTLHSIPFQLLPPPGPKNFYVVLMAVCAFTFKTTAYAGAPGSLQVNDPSGGFVGTFAQFVITQTINQADWIAGSNTSPAPINHPINIQTSVADPTLGDGLITVTVYYTIETLP